MYHGIPLDYHLIVFVFAILAWIGRGLYKAFQQVSRQVRGGGANVPRPIGAPNALPPAVAEAQRQAMARQQAMAAQQQAMTAQGQRPGPPLNAQTPPQAPPYRTVPPMRAREMPRRPDAGGPAVPQEASDDDLRRQERELIAAEPSGLGTPLTGRAAARREPAPALLGNTDDLVRAIILQEVLGPPLSRRNAAPPTSPR